jgi:hypothetical protein
MIRDSVSVWRLTELMGTVLCRSSEVRSPTPSGCNRRANLSIEHYEMRAERARIGGWNSMAIHVPTVDIHELLEPYHVHYEVFPYYVMSEQFPVGGPPVIERVQAGFDVNLYAVLETARFPLLHSDAAHRVINFLESAGQEIQSTAGNHCTVEVIPCTDSAVLDAQEHFQPQEMLRIRISHARGLDRPEGPAEELALKATEELLHELGIRRR